MRVALGPAVALAEAQRYYAEHPGSPSAARRPRLTRCGDTFVALLGRNLQNGIAGIGNTVAGALRAFDVQYCRALRHPIVEKSGRDGQQASHAGC